MPGQLKVLQPDYFKRFHCIGATCEDTCCEGMGVLVDKYTYLKYRGLPQSELKTMLDESVSESALSVSDSTYAQIRSPHTGCVFLTEQKLCRIQLTLGEAYLSRTCSVYPRAMSTVDEVVERSLYMSCPEAARVALLNPDKMTFAHAIMPDDPRFVDFPVLDSGWTDHTNKPYRHFPATREFVIALLQNRDYEVWERLVIIGLFCDKLNRLIDDYHDNEIPAPIDAFTAHIQADELRETLAGVTSRHGLQVQSVIESLEHRIATSSTGIRFLDCYAEFLQGIKYTADAGPAEVESRYTDACEQVYRPFFAERRHILENYLVNYVFRNLFPFGPQSGLFYDPLSVHEEFMLLTIHYVIVRTMLVGLSAFHRSRFDETHVIKLIQAFSKDIEHNKPFLKRICQSLTDSNMAGLAYLAVLIKD